MRRAKSGKSAITQLQPTSVAAVRTNAATRPGEWNA